MSPLTGFIIVLIAVTFQFTLYTIKRLQEPIEPKLFNTQKSFKMKKPKINYYKDIKDKFFEAIFNLKFFDFNLWSNISIVFIKIFMNYYY